MKFHECRSWQNNTCLRVTLGVEVQPNTRGWQAVRVDVIMPGLCFFRCFYCKLDHAAHLPCLPLMHTLSLSHTHMHTHVHSLGPFSAALMFVRLASQSWRNKVFQPLSPITSPSFLSISDIFYHFFMPLSSSFFPPLPHHYYPPPLLSFLSSITPPSHLPSCCFKWVSSSSQMFSTILPSFFHTHLRTTQTRTHTHTQPKGCWCNHVM